MAKDKKIIVVEKVSKDQLSIGMNSKYAELWPMAVTSVVETFIRLSKVKGVPDSVIGKTLGAMVQTAIEEAGGFKDAVDEVISDENIG